MMRYTVVWHVLAQAELAEIWLSSGDRAAVTQAADLVDLELSEDPDQKGTVVSPRSRELTNPPLQVLFRVLPHDRLVQVFAVTMLDV